MSLSIEEQRIKIGFKQKPLSSKKRILQNGVMVYVSKREPVYSEFRAKKQKPKRTIKLRKGKNLYLTNQWKSLRKRVLIRDEFTCKHCGRKSNLHVHHLKYATESQNHLMVPMTSLLTLCKPCHQVVHNKEF